MIIAFPISSKSNRAKISERFARAPFFALLYTTTDELKIIENPYYKDELRVGENVIWLMQRYNVQAYAGAEFGLKLQEGAANHKVQLILLDHSVKNLTDLDALIKSRKNSK